MLKENKTKIKDLELNLKRTTKEKMQQKERAETEERKVADNAT